VRQVWDLYVAANWSTLRPKTQTRYAGDWRQWELYAGVGFVAEDVTPAMLHGFRRALEGRRYSVNMIRGIVSVCKLVYNWAEREELIGRNRWRLYQLKIAKDAQPESPAEYRHEDLEALLRQFDPGKASQWRPWVALTILGAQGVRQVAALQLRWSDLNLRHRVIVWPKATDKRGRDWPQPLGKAAVRALRVARDMAWRQSVQSPFVLYGTRGAPCYTIQSLWKALRHAEEKAGIPHRPQRAGHGFRRMVVGDLATATGNVMLALRAVGDQDARMAKHYLKDRDDELRRAFRVRDRVSVVAASQVPILTDAQVVELLNAPPGSRTQNLGIKSPLLCQLS
jgi:integrase